MRRKDAKVGREERAEKKSLWDWNGGKSDLSLAACFGYRRNGGGKKRRRSPIRTYSRSLRQSRREARLPDPVSDEDV